MVTYWGRLEDGFATGLLVLDNTLFGVVLDEEFALPDRKVRRAPRDGGAGVKSENGEADVGNESLPSNLQSGR